MLRRAPQINRPELTGESRPAAVHADPGLAWQVLDSLSDALLLVDESARILELNTVARRLLGPGRSDHEDCSLDEIMTWPKGGGSKMEALVGKRCTLDVRTGAAAEVTCDVTVTSLAGIEQPLYAVFLRPISNARQNDEDRREPELPPRARFVPAPGGRQRLAPENLPIRDSLGQVQEINQSLEVKIAERTLALQREVEDRRVTEAALKESEAKFRRLFENTRAGVLLLDGQTLLEINPAGLKMIGLSTATEAVGRSLLEFSAPVQAGGLSAPVAAEAMARQRAAEGSLRFEWICRNAAGEEFPIEVLSSSVEFGGKTFAQVILQDISERKRAEHELRSALERERELGQLKSSFISMVSHEYRNPLGVILSSTELLKRYHERLTPVERMESLIDIEAATRRMASMIDNLLLMGKADAGKLELKPRAIDLLALCRVLIAETISSNHVGREISLEYEGIDSPAMSDEQILRLILSNLLTNALKYSPRERVPRLRVARVGRHVFITVYDQGIGIPEEDRPALFQAFRRARNVGLTSGTGLGLYTVKRCVDLHNGTIDIASVVGQGTTVVITLPVFPGTAEGRHLSRSTLAAPP